MRLWQSWRQYARQLKSETYALYLAYRDPRVPWPAKLLAAGVVAYAFSPIDLIPDFIPVLGHLDDIVIVPAAGNNKRQSPVSVAANIRYPQLADDEGQRRNAQIFDSGDRDNHRVSGSACLSVRQLAMLKVVKSLRELWPR